MPPADTPALTVEATRTYRRHVEAAAAAIRERDARLPPRALVLDPAVGGLADLFSARTEWAAADLPHFPETDGPTTLAVGTLGPTPTVVLDGALSLADGHTPREVVFPIRVLVEAGVDTVLFVNTAESLRAEIEPSALVLATDHINLQGANPLVGPNVDAWGPRFPDMTEPYAPSLRRHAEATARREGLSLRQGVYLALLGPNRCTRAEARMVRSMGADLVGTSTVPEVIAARHMGAEVMAVSIVTRQLLPAARRPDVGDASGALDAARPRLHTLLDGTLAALASEEKSV